MSKRSKAMKTITTTAAINYSMTINNLDFEDEFTVNGVHFVICGVVLYGKHCGNRKFIAVVKIRDEWFHIDNDKMTKMDMPESSSSSRTTRDLMMPVTTPSTEKTVSFSTKEKKKRFGYSSDNFSPYVIFFQKVFSPSPPSPPPPPPPPVTSVLSVQQPTFENLVVSLTKSLGPNFFRGQRNFGKMFLTRCSPLAPTEREALIRKYNSKMSIVNSSQHCGKISRKYTVEPIEVSDLPSHFQFLYKAIKHLFPLFSVSSHLLYSPSGSAMQRKICVTMIFLNMIILIFI